MSRLQLAIEASFIQRLGWTLLHSLWQGLAVTILLVVALAILRKRGPKIRYVACCGAMLIFATAPVVTFLMMPAPVDTGTSGVTKLVAAPRSGKEHAEPVVIPRTKNPAMVKAAANDE